MKVQLLVWIFVMRIMMVVASGVSYLINAAIAKARYADRRQDELRGAAHVPRVADVDPLGRRSRSSCRSSMIPDLGDGTLWWKLSAVITCGTLAGAIIPEFVKVFTSTESRHVKEVVTSSREGGPSLNILSGLVAGNFSAYWLGITIMAPDVGRVLDQHSHGPRRADGRARRCSRSVSWRSASSAWVR